MLLCVQHLPSFLSQINEPHKLTLFNPQITLEQTTYNEVKISDKFSLKVEAFSRCKEMRQ